LTLKIVTIVGARPQFVKAATVSRAIAAQNLKHPQQSMEEKIVHTGQHYDANMSDVFFEEMRIPRPAYHLGVGGGSHGAMTGRMLEKIEEVLLQERPHWVLVYGDTNSTLAGALAAKKLHIRVAHVEAGLRSFNMRMPEEQNRILTDRLSDLLCCPTDAAVSNLEKEGFRYFPCHVAKTGDVMYDAALFYRAFARRPEIAKLGEGDFILCTLHRAENTDDKDRMGEILAALRKVACEKKVVLPLHPRTRNTLMVQGHHIHHENLLITEPVGYLEMVWMLERCAMVMTDSGGLQKEACFFRKPCITLRDETEWVELVQAGVNRLAGAEESRILESVIMMKDKKVSDNGLYGTGNSAEQVVDLLLAHG
jgi:UDP-GlcNAc3NAcA epimerase